MVTLEPTHTPHWSLVSEHKLTVWPSVDFRARGRRCHYFINYGRIIWVPEKEWIA